MLIPRISCFLLTAFLPYRISWQVQVLILSLIGNTVKTGRARRCDLDPSSVFYSGRRRTLSADIATVSYGIGKAAVRAGKSEDLPEQICETSFAERGVVYTALRG